MTFPLITPDVSDKRYRGYWDGFQQGEIRIPQCRSCDEYHWYPKPICPTCNSSNYEWVPISGHGELYTYSRIEYDFGLSMFEGNLPWHVGLVEIDEDRNIRLVSALDIPDEQLDVGIRVKAEFVSEIDQFPAPVWVNE